MNIEEKSFNESVIVASSRIIKVIILINEIKGPSYLLIGGCF